MAITNVRTTNNSNNQTGNTGGNPLGGLRMNPMGTDPDDVLAMLINYNEKYKTANPILFRDEVVNQTIATLIGKDKPNALLIGNAGVGKTKIVEDIARRLANNDPFIPTNLTGHTIYELPLSSIVAGSGVVGQIEEKVLAVLDFFKDTSNKAILFIDEIHLIKEHIYEKISEILKPAMARGDIKVIGSTTNTEAVELAKDPAFNRRFSRIIIDELTIEQTEQILELSLSSYIMHYQNQIVIDKATIPYIVRTASQYSHSGNHRPDNALTLLDRACADSIVARKISEEKLKNDPQMLQILTGTPNIVTEKRVKQTALRMLTGSAKKDKIDRVALVNAMSNIKGQDAIVKKVVDKIIKTDNNYFPKVQPLTMLFAGPSGVGKTEIAKILGREIKGEKPIILNMTEYNSPSSISRIIGAPAGYVGYSDKNELPFDKLETNPYQIVLLDEFEKADRSVQRLFMQVMNEGTLKLSDGRELDFSKAVIIATTNAGQTNAKKMRLGFGEDTSTTKTTDTLKQYFDIELLNRFEEILEFNEISKDTYKQILSDIYERESARINKEFPKVSLPLVLTDVQLDEMTEKSYNRDFGARPAMRIIKEHIEDII